MRQALFSCLVTRVEDTRQEPKSHKSLDARLRSAALRPPARGFDSGGLGGGGGALFASAPTSRTAPPAALSSAAAIARHVPLPLGVRPPPRTRPEPRAPRWRTDAEKSSFPSKVGLF